MVSKRWKEFLKWNFTRFQSNLINSRETVNQFHLRFLGIFQRSSVKVFLMYDHPQFSSSQDFLSFTSFFLRAVRFYDKKQRLRSRRSSRGSKERIEGRGRTKIRVDCKIVTASLAAQLFRIRGAYKKARFPRPAASGILSPRTEGDN